MSPVSFKRLVQKSNSVAKLERIAADVRLFNLATATEKLYLQSFANAEAVLEEDQDDPNLQEMAILLKIKTQRNKKLGDKTVLKLLTAAGSQPRSTDPPPAAKSQHSVVLGDRAWLTDVQVMRCVECAVRIALLHRPHPEIRIEYPTDTAVRSFPSLLTPYILVPDVPKEHAPSLNSPRWLNRSFCNH